jgi:hypothetical protein
MYSAETTARLDFLRTEAQRRELTTAEAREAISLIRQDRITASTVSAKSKAAKAPKAEIDPSAVLSKLVAAMGGAK